MERTNGINDKSGKSGKEEMNEKQLKKLFYYAGVEYALLILQYLEESKPLEVNN